MVWRNVARIVLAGAEAVGKAFARAVQEELNATKQAAARQTAADQAAGTSSSSSSESSTRTQQRKATELNGRLGITLQESMQILDVKPPLDVEEIRKRYEHLFAVNDKAKGGTIYLQAKVYRAKERLDAELERLERERIEKEERGKEQKQQQEEGEDDKSEQQPTDAK